MMLNWIISSSLLIVAVIVLRFALRGRVSPAIGYALWLVVLVRLLMPFSVMHVPYSAASLVESTQLSQDLERLEQVTSVEHKSDGEIIGYVEGFFHLDGTPNNGVHTQIAENADEEEFARWQRSSNVKNFGENILRPAWIAGIVLVAAWFLVINAIFTHRLRRTRQKMELDCPRPVYISEAVETPCLHGLLSPAIYVTPAVAADEVALRHVLSHELSHYRHRDHIWGIFRAAALALHWYNPLVWYAAALSRRDAELACDEAAIEALGEERRMDYGRTLIALSCRSARANDLILTATTMTGGKRTLKERIVLIAKKPQTKAAAVFFAAVIVIFAAVFTFAGSLPMGSYMRDSSAGHMPFAYRFHYDKNITQATLLFTTYQDGVLVAQEKQAFDAKDFRGIRLVPEYDGDAFVLTYRYSGAFGEEEKTYLLEEDIWNSQVSWGGRANREILPIDAGNTVELMHYNFGKTIDWETFELGQEIVEHTPDDGRDITDILQHDLGRRIIIEVHFE